MNNRLLTHARATALAGAVLLVPLDLFLAFGFTFTFREHEPLVAWLFVYSAFLLDVPALLIGVFKPKIGAWFLLINSTTSLLIASVFLLIKFLQAGEPSPVLPFRLLALAWQAGLLWLPKFLYIALIFWLAKKRSANGRVCAPVA